MAMLNKAKMGLLAGKLFSSAIVSRVDKVSGHYRIIEIESEVLPEKPVLPGDKIGVLVNGDKRCYTPIPSGPDEARLRLGVYLHGSGPGSNWAASLTESDTVLFAGPRPSLDFKSIGSPCTFFGDETSIAVAIALQDHLRGLHASRFVFEVNSIQEARDVVAALDLRNTSLVERRADNAHIPEIGAHIRDAVRSMDAQHLVLTGCGPSMQSLRKELSETELQYAKNMVKAYWAPGKVALD